MRLDGCASVDNPNDVMNKRFYVSTVFTLKGKDSDPASVECGSPPDNGLLYPGLEQRQTPPTVSRPFVTTHPSPYPGQACDKHTPPPPHPSKRSSCSLRH